MAILWLTQSPAKAANEQLTQTIRGTVVDKINHATLPGANVIILNSQPLVGTVTDVNGRFRLEKVALGRVSLKISFLGYQDVVLTNLNLNTGKEVVLEVEMEELVITQKVVEIKAKADKSATNNEMTTVSSRGFSVEETQRYAGSLNDVARMASNFAGMSGANDARNDIVIRGNSPTGLSWRLEGVEIPNPNHFGASSSTGGPVCMINNNLLANSDFLTGAFPSEYGNATSGVFDLKLRNGNNEKHEFLGQIGFNGFELGAEGPIQKSKGSSYLVNYRYSTLSVMKAMGFDFGTGTGIPFYQDGSFKINLPSTKIGSFSVFGLGGKSDIKIWDSEKDTTKTQVDFYGGEGFDLTNGSEMFTGGLTHTLIFNKNIYTRLILSASRHNFKTSMDSLVPHTVEKIAYYRNDFTENMLTASFIYNQKFSSRMNLKAGVTARNEDFDLQESVFFAEDQAMRTTTAFVGKAMLYQAYAQLQYKFSENLKLDGGLHTQRYSVNNAGSFEPRLGMKWEYANNRAFSIGYGMHSQILPATIYFRQTRMPDGSYKKLNEDLPMLESQHLVLGHDWNLNENLRLKTEAYGQYLQHAGVNGGQNDYYSLLNEGASFGYGTPDTLKSTGTGYNYGLELTLEHFLNKGLYYLATVSLFDSKYKGSDDKIRNTAFNTNYVVNLLLGKEFALGKASGNSKKALNYLGFDIKTTWAGGQRYVDFITVKNPEDPFYHRELLKDNAYEKRYGDYLRTDLKISFRRNGKKITQEFAIDIQNLFDQKNMYSEQFNRQTGEKTNVYQMGRLIIPQYRINF